MCIIIIIIIDEQQQQLYEDKRMELDDKWWGIEIEYLSNISADCQLHYERYSIWWMISQLLAWLLERLDDNEITQHISTYISICSHRSGQHQDTNTYMYICICIWIYVYSQKACILQWYCFVFIMNKISFWFHENLYNDLFAFFSFIFFSVVIQQLEDYF